MSDLSSVFSCFKAEMQDVRSTIESALQQLTTDKAMTDMEELAIFLKSIEGLSKDEMYDASIKLPNSPNHVIVLYKLEPEQHLTYLRRLLQHI